MMEIDGLIRVFIAKRQGNRFISRARRCEIMLIVTIDRLIIISNFDEN